jgi:beta-glucosidase-like glycosyl hydrolase
VYRQVLEAVNQPAVMTSHMGYESINPETPCSLSIGCVDQISQNYPRTLIMTDALEMEAAGYQTGPTATAGATVTDRTLSQRAIAAIEAGNQVLLFGDGADSQEVAAAYQAVLEKYQRNENFRSLVDQSVQMILKYKHQLIGLNVNESQ